MGMGTQDAVRGKHGCRVWGGDDAQNGGVAIWAAVCGFAATPDVGEMGCRPAVTEKPDLPDHEQ